MKYEYIILFLLCVSLVGAVDSLNMQGILRNSTTNDLLNISSIVFNITMYYQTNDSVAYSEQTNLAVNSGVWDYVIGKSTSISHWLFQHDLYFKLKVGTDILSSQNFSHAPYAFYAQNSDLLDGQEGTYYQDWNSTSDIWAIIDNGTLDVDGDADAWNSTQDIWAVITNGSFYHKSEADAADDWNTTQDIRNSFLSSSNISYNSATGIFHFNMTCEQITGGSGLCDGTDATGSGSGNCSADGVCSLITYDSELSYINNCSVSNSCSDIIYQGAKLGNTTTEIRNQFSGGSNITIESGVISFNMTCEQITGSAGLCDGDDAAGGGGGAGLWMDENNWIQINTTLTSGRDDVNITGDLYVGGIVRKASLGCGNITGAVSNLCTVTPGSGSENCSVNNSCDLIVYSSELATNLSSYLPLSAGIGNELTGVLYTTTLEPSIPLTYDFGTSSTAYQDGYVEDIYIDYLGNLQALTQKYPISSLMSNIIDTNISWVRNQFSGGSNITIESGIISFNMTCEQITGSAGLCDGDDASAAGGSQWDISTSYYMINDSNILDINETRLNATIEALDSVGSGSNNCSVNNSCDLIVYSSELATNLSSYLPLSAGSGKTLTGNLHTKHIYLDSNNAYDIGQQGGAGRDLYFQDVFTSQIGNVADITQKFLMVDLFKTIRTTNTSWVWNIVTNGSFYHKSEADAADAYNADFDTEDEVEAAIFDNDNTANLNMSTYNITFSDGVSITRNSTGCLILGGLTSEFIVC